MDKIFALILSITLALTLTGCKADIPAPENSSLIGHTEISNPFVSCDSMSAAAELAGFELALPKGIGSGELRVIENEMIEVGAKSDDGKELRIRKAAGNQDISGDYNSYAENTEITVDGLTVTLKGSDGKFNTAIWTDGEFVFSLSCSQGLSQEEISTMIAHIK